MDLFLKRFKKEEKEVQNVKLPFKASDSILSGTERTFYNTLRQALGDKYIICPKLGSANFLLCDPTNSRPVCGLALNDASHTFEEDQLIDKAYNDEGIPLIRFASKPAYTANEINEALSYTFSQTPKSIPKEVPEEIYYEASVEPVQEESNFNVDDIILCPKCNVPMVLRKGAWGRNAGKVYYACVNPDCKETVEK
jgi:hypothetical protein